MASFKKRIGRVLAQTTFRPFPLARTIYYNFLRKNTKHPSRKSLLLSTSYAVFDIHKSAKLIIKGIITFGYKRYRGSRLETSLLMEEGSVFEAGSEKGGFSVSHGSDFQIFKGAHLKIGSCAINRNVQIICQDNIEIGDDVLISRDVVIRDNDGGHKVLTENYQKTAPVHIGNHVWIGQGAMILKGVTIGDGSIISAGAIVTTSVKPKSLVVPMPSRTLVTDVEWEA